MARARGIKPGFFRNADLVELSFETRLLFIGLWTLADRAGRLEDRPKQIKMELFPADSVDCEAMLEDLATIDAIDRYEVDGKRFIQVTNFKRHQNPHKDEKASVIPDRDGNTEPEMAKPCKHHASTMQAPCKDGGSTVAILLTPDSLTPDSLIKEEPNGSVSAKARTPKLPACPYDQIVELYHANLPTLPSIRTMDGKRKAKIREFWVWVLTTNKSDGQRRAIGADQALTWIGQFFKRAEENDFITGRIERTGRHSSWQAGIEYLCSENGRNQVIERTRSAA